MLTNYNNTIALQLTPTGQVLIPNRLFTAAQLGVGDTLCYNNPNNQPVNSLCAIAPPAPLAPAGQGNSDFCPAGAQRPFRYDDCGLQQKSAVRSFRQAQLRAMSAKYAERTGGEVMKSSKDEVSAKLTQLVDEIRARYTIGYYPSVKQPKGKFCEIKLRIRTETEKRQDRLLVRTRTGYYR